MARLSLYRHLRVDLILLFYLAWELEVEQVFSHHDFSKLERVRDATRAFSGFASVWWSVHCKKNIDNQPTTWKDLKVVMRQQFFLLTIIVNYFANWNN